jgi:hypothetical protein
MKLLIVIENKVEARENDHQTKAYWEFMKETDEDYDYDLPIFGNKLLDSHNLQA